jgi:hypothetical protein
MLVPAYIRYEIKVKTVSHYLYVFFANVIFCWGEGGIRLEICCCHNCFFKSQLGMYKHSNLGIVT